LHAAGLPNGYVKIDQPIFLSLQLLAVRDSSCYRQVCLQQLIAEQKTNLLKHPQALNSQSKFKRITANQN